MQQPCVGQVRQTWGIELSSRDYPIRSTARVTALTMVSALFTGLFNAMTQRAF